MCFYFPPKADVCKTRVALQNFSPWACQMSNLKFRYDRWHLFALCCIYFPPSLEATCADGFVNQGRVSVWKIQKEAFLLNTFMYYSVPRVSVAVNIKREDIQGILTQFLVTKYWQSETNFWLNHFVGLVWNNSIILFHIYLHRSNATTWNLACRSTTSLRFHLSNLNSRFLLDSNTPKFP